MAVTAHQEMNLAHHIGGRGVVLGGLWMVYIC